MARKPVAPFVVIAVFAILAVLAWTFFEIRPTPKPVPESRQSKKNQFLAFDRWLSSMGIPVRVLSSGNLSVISKAKEQHIFIMADVFDWTEEAVAYFAKWIEDGGTLYLALDDYHASREGEINAMVLSLLETFYIKARLLEDDFSDYSDDESKDINAFPDFSAAYMELSRTEAQLLQYRNDKVLLLKDYDGITRIIQVDRFKGRLIVSGIPGFLVSTNLRHEPNARLAWGLFASNAQRDQSPESGWLFIRGVARAREPGIIGSLFKYGNLAVIGISTLVLLIVGFWAAIPLFGMVRHDPERQGKSLQERFLAEGRFLKSYGALGLYRDSYVKEIRRRLVEKEGITDDEAVINRLLPILGKTDDESKRLLINAIGIGNEPFTDNEFPKMISIFKTILEKYDGNRE
jgi:hypothetical protein